MRKERETDPETERGETKMEQSHTQGNTSILQDLRSGRDEETKGRERASGDTGRLQHQRCCEEAEKLCGKINALQQRKCVGQEKDDVKATRAVFATVPARTRTE